MKKNHGIIKLFATALIAVVIASIVRSAWYTPAWAPIREAFDRISTPIVEAYRQYILPLIPTTTDDAENPTTQPERKLYGPYTVVRVVDGDTAIIDIDGAETRVRFIGIDTPESVNPDESKNSPEGEIASQFTKKLLTDQQIWLEYDIEKEDAYGRTLAYLYLDPASRVTVQEQILRAGMATTMTIQPNSKYADVFYTAQIAARESGAGLWATGFWP